MCKPHNKIHSNTHNTLFGSRQKDNGLTDDMNQLWGATDAYGIPPHIEQKLRKKGHLILYISSALFLSALFPEIVPQLYEIMSTMQFENQEKTSRMILFFAGTFGLGWYFDRVWPYTKSQIDKDDKD